MMEFTARKCLVGIPRTLDGMDGWTDGLITAHRYHVNEAK